MTDATLSQAIEEAYATAPAGEVILHTLEFRHPDFTEPLRVVRDKADLLATLESTAPVDPSTQVTFVGYAFDLQLPEVSTGTSPEVTISIDNVSTEILTYMDLAANSDDLIEVTYRSFLSSDTSAPQNDPPLTLVIRDVEADVFRISARAGYGNFANKPFPREVYDLERFPGLVSL